MVPLKKYLALDRKSLSAVGRASVVGMHMVSGVAVGCGFGWLLDYLLGTRPWLLLVFFVLGVAAGFRNVWMDMRIILNAQDRADRAERAERADRTNGVPSARGLESASREDRRPSTPDTPDTPSMPSASVTPGARPDDTGGKP